jgi:3-oxoacyl-[acyl-carrier protein] reductase
MKLAGQVALVTGGSRGIGRATALAFASEGADIAFCHLDDGAKGEETANEIRALGRRAMHQSLDVVDIAGSRAFAQAVTAAFGPIDILFNNAGMNIRKRFEDYTEADYDRILDVHMKGMFFMAQAVYPAMAARGRGCIINVASQRGLNRASRTEKAQALDAAAQLVVRGRRYWLQLTPRSWNALCWMVVGLVTMVSG